VPRETICVSFSSDAICHDTSMGPVALRVAGGVTRVQRMTRSVSGSPLATLCLNSVDAGSPADCCARSASGIAAADAVAVWMNSRREMAMGWEDPNSVSGMNA
jgi:hypothetical protein